MMNHALIFLVIILCFQIIPSGATAEKRDAVRTAKYSGTYYPSDKNILIKAVRGFTSKAVITNKEFLRENGSLKAVIMPHGRINTTGQINGFVSRVLKENKFDRIILLSHSHYLAYNTSSVSGYEYWESPLGQTAVHKGSQSLIKTYPEIFRRIGFSDNVEHSIESVLPFFQFSLNDFSIIPILTGRCDVGKTANALVQLTHFSQPEKSGFYEKTLYVVVTNLSRNLSYQQAINQDRKALDMILRLDAKMLAEQQNSACGIQPVLILIDIAKRFKWRPHLLHYSTNRAANTSNKKNVMGYAAVAFYGGTSMKKKGRTGDAKLSDNHGKLLLQIARRTIAKRLGYKTSEVAIPDDPVLRSGRGLFVTLKIDNQLRGCIGNLSSEISVADGVASNAMNAAFNDNRFPPLEKDELELTEIEVSILTEPSPLEYIDAKDLISKLKPGIDGVIIRKGRVSATFLPQVWDQLSKPVDFLEHLCLKAGLTRDEWRVGKLDVSTYQVQYFKE